MSDTQAVAVPVPAPSPEAQAQARGRAKKRREGNPDRQQRMLVLDVHCADKEQRKPVLESLKKYRAVARQMFGAAFCGYAAGCEIQDTPGAFRVLPKNDAAKAILEQTFGKTGKAPLYSLRDWVRQEALGPDWLSFVWDSLRAVTWERWVAKDPEFPKASRGFLALNGARNLAQCAFIGLQCPIASARPKLEERSVTVKFRESLGPIKFDLNKLDGGRWRTWLAIREGRYKAGTVTITERDGWLRLLIPYSLPVQRHESDPTRVANLKVNGLDLKNTILVTCGTDRLEEVSAQGALSVLLRLKAQKQRFERAKNAAGSKNRPWGFKKAFVGEQDKIARLTARREGLQKDWNHAWTRRIADWAVSQRVSKILLHELPPGGEAQDKKRKDAQESAQGEPDQDAVAPQTDPRLIGLCGQPWQWSQFKACLAYKLAFFGIALVELDKNGQEKAAK